MKPSFDQFITRYRAHLVRWRDTGGDELPSLTDMPEGVLTPEQAELWRRVYILPYAEWDDCGDTDKDLWLSSVESAINQIDRYVAGTLGRIVHVMRISYLANDASEGVTLVAVDDSTTIWLSGAAKHSLVQAIKAWLLSHPAKTGTLDGLRLPKQAGVFYQTSQGNVRQLFESETGPRA